MEPSRGHGEDSPEDEGLACVRSADENHPTRRGDDLLG